MSIDKYKKRLIKSINSLSEKKINFFLKILEKKIKNKQKIFVCGNGGSAAISNHYICDYLKLIRENTKYKPRIISLSTNIELISAISNDISYKKIFTYQLQSLVDKYDLLILISSSGNSSNMIDVLKYAKKNKVFTVAFTGFKGGFLKKNSDLSIHTNADSYSVSEDTHHILMHYTMEQLIKNLNSIKN